MGITVIQKSDLSVRRRSARVALVLAGGAVTGGAFKLGGLKALDDFLVNRKTTEFDIHVGLSAGAFLAVPLAAGVTPAEMMRSLDGGSERFSGLRPADVYNPNLEELIQKPLQFLLDLAAFPARLALDLVAAGPGPLEDAARSFAADGHGPSARTAFHLLAATARRVLARRSFPAWMDYLPSAPFDNSTLERYLRENMARAGLPNDFPSLHRLTGRDLRIVAMNLDTAERVVFGHDVDSSVAISQAVQASTALPGFYRPVHLNGRYYVDGGVHGTANVDVAIDGGADLVICYNPFRPVFNRVDGAATDGDGSLARRGFLPVLNQVFRTMLHSRLQLGLQRYCDDPRFHGDIIVIEPAEADIDFFAVNPFAFWKRRWAARHGYASVTRSLNSSFEQLRPIFRSYGIEIRRPVVPLDAAALRDERPVGGTEPRGGDGSRPSGRVISGSFRAGSAPPPGRDGAGGAHRRLAAVSAHRGGSAEWWKHS